MKFVRSVIIIIFVIFITAFAFFINSVLKISHIPPKNQNCEFATVLTGANNRIPYALDLSLKYQVKNLFISGVNQKTSLKEIINIDEVKDINIFLGRKASNTYENAFEILEWLQTNNTKKVLLITSDYHIIRSLMTLKKYCYDGLQIFPIAVPSKRNAEFVKHCFKEFFKVIFFKFFYQFYSTRNY